LLIIIEVNTFIKKLLTLTLAGKTMTFFHLYQ
jgi:hypothetical protein